MMLNKRVTATYLAKLMTYRLHFVPYPSPPQAVNEEKIAEDDKELAERIIKEKQLISLQFYPDTPVGFYKVYGTTFEEIVKKALDCLSPK